MSLVQGLKTHIDWFTQQARSTADELQTYQLRFSEAASQVQEMIGGSAQSADKNVLTAIDEAKSKLDAAVAALQEAASQAGRYGDSL